jgi:hypothetical protein
MTWVIRRVSIHPPQLVALLATVALGSILTACSSSASGAVGTSGETEAFVLVNTSSPPVITVQNRSAQPLVDVNLTIKSGMLAFTDRISRLEANETRTIRHNDFASRDGTSFNLRVARPREVVVSAKNLEGKAFETSQPWQ